MFQENDIIEEQFPPPPYMEPIDPPDYESDENIYSVNILSQLNHQQSDTRDSLYLAQYSNRIYMEGETFFNDKFKGVDGQSGGSSGNVPELINFRYKNYNDILLDIHLIIQKIY